MEMCWVQVSPSLDNGQNIKYFKKISIKIINKKFVF